MLDSEPNTNETSTNEATGRGAGTAPAPTFNEPAAPAVPVAFFQPPQVLFQPPPASAGEREADRDEPEPDSRPRRTRGARTSEARGDEPDAAAEVSRPARRTRTRAAAAVVDEPAADQPVADADEGSRPARRTRTRAAAAVVDEPAADQPVADADEGSRPRRTRGRGRSRARDAADDEVLSVDAAAAVEAAEDDQAPADAADGEESASGRRRRRRNTRTRGRGEATAEDGADADDSADEDAEDEGDESAEGGSAGRRRRRKRRRGSADSDSLAPDDPPDTVVHVRAPHNPADDVRAIKGSTRLEAKKQRRREGRESGRRRPPVVTESEFLARRESVERTMVVRQRGDRTQIAVLEDDVLVEHYVNRTTHASYVGNVYLGKVQNVLPSMEAAFVDIGKGRNAVLYAGEVNFDASGLEGQPKRIEAALKPGQSVIVQVTKDPVGHKGARLTSQVSLPGRYLVYVPGASMTGISRKLPDTERTRLKQILKKVTPEHAGVIVRTAAEGAAEAELERDITRLAAQWESIEKKAKTASAPALLHGEPDLTVRVIRDVFNEDFAKLIVSGDEGWEIIDEYVRYVAPHLADRISRWDSPDNDDADDDVFAAYRVDEQLAKALERKVWLPSGGSLVIDRTEAMTVIDVNTGKFTGQGGNLEETVTRNNLEAAEEIVRQLRLRDIGGIIVVDFIDMVLESNRELVLRRLLECLARDRTKHQVAEVTSLGLVQMTRKRVGAGLLEAFSQQCECCNGRGVIITLDAPAEPAHRASVGAGHRPVPAPPGRGNGNGSGNGNGNGRGQGKGNGNGRRGDRRDDDRSDFRGDVTPALVASSALADSAIAGSALADSAVADSASADRAGTVVAGSGAGAATASAPAASQATTAETANGGRRTRRSTSAAGTAFATAVVVEDTPPVVPVVTSAPPAEPEPVTVADPGVAPSRPRTRTRAAGSATARVTATADPGPAPEPQPAADQAVADTEAFPVTEASVPAEQPVGPVPDTAGEPGSVPASLFDAVPAAEQEAPVTVADVAAVPPADPELVPAEQAEPAAPVSAEPAALAEPVSAEPAEVAPPVSAEPAPATPAEPDQPADGTDGQAG